MGYHVYRVTTDKLDKQLNDTHPSEEVEQTIHVGGRDWVVITSCNAGHTGWVEDQAERHEDYLAFVSEYGIELPAGAHDGSILPDCLGLVKPEVQWGDIKYGRYDNSLIDPEFSGWVEDAGQTWIIFLGKYGNPHLYYPRRDESGGVIGEPIRLAS